MRSSLQMPDYPESRRKGKHKIQLTCVLGITVDKEVLVRDVHVTRSSDKRLDQSAFCDRHSTTLGSILSADIRVVALRFWQPASGKSRRSCADKR